MGNILSDQFGSRNPSNPEFYNNNLNEVLFRKYIHSILINRTDLINGNELHINRRKAFCRTTIDKLEYTYAQNLTMTSPADNINVRLPGIYNTIQAHTSVLDKKNTIKSRIDNFDVLLKINTIDSVNQIFQPNTTNDLDQITGTCDNDVHEICAKQLYDNNCIVNNNSTWEYNSKNSKCNLYNNNLNTLLSTITNYDTIYSRNNIILSDATLDKYDYLCNFLKYKKSDGTYVPKPDIGILTNWGLGNLYSNKVDTIINGYSNNRSRQFNSPSPYIDDDYINDVRNYINVLNILNQTVPPIIPTVQESTQSNITIQPITIQPNTVTDSKTTTRSNTTTRSDTTTTTPSNTTTQSDTIIPTSTVSKEVSQTIALQELYNNLRRKIIINYLVINENLYMDPLNSSINFTKLNMGDTSCNCLNGLYGDNIKLNPKTKNPLVDPSTGQTPNVSYLLNILNNYNINVPVISSSSSKTTSSKNLNTSNMRGAYLKTEFKIAQASLRYYYYYYDSDNKFKFASPQNFQSIYTRTNGKFYDEYGNKLTYYYHNFPQLPISFANVNLNDPAIYNTINTKTINMFLENIIDNSGPNVLNQIDLSGNNTKSTIFFQNTPVSDLSKTNSIYSMKLQAMASFVDKDETSDVSSCYNNLYNKTSNNQLPYYRTTTKSGQTVTCVNTFNLNNINANSLTISDIIMNNTCGNAGPVTNFFPIIPENSSCPTGGDPNGTKGQILLCLTGFNIDITNTNTVVPSLFSPFNGEYRSCNKTDVYCSENTYIKVSDPTIYLEFNYTSGKYNISLIKQINGALNTVVISKEFLYNSSGSNNNEEMCLSGAFLSLYILYLHLKNISDPTLQEQTFKSYMSTNIINFNYIAVINTVLNPSSQQLIEPSGSSTISASFINYLNKNIPSYIWLTNNHLSSSLPTAGFPINGMITTGPSNLTIKTGSGTGFLVSNFNYLDSYNFYIFSNNITDTIYGQGIFVNNELANITPYMVIENYTTTPSICQFLDIIPNTTVVIPNNSISNCPNIPVGSSGILNLSKIFSASKPILIYCPSIYRYLLISNQIVLGASDCTNENIGSVTSTHIKQSNLNTISDQLFITGRYGLTKISNINNTNEWLIVSYDNFIKKLGAVFTQNIDGVQITLTFNNNTIKSYILTKFNQYVFKTNNDETETIILQLVNFKWIITLNGVSIYQSSNNITDSIDFITNYINNTNIIIKNDYWTNVENPINKTIKKINMNIITYYVIELEVVNNAITKNIKSHMNSFINKYFSKGNIINNTININITQSNTLSLNSFILIEFYLLNIELLSGYYRNSEFFIKELANDINLGYLVTFNYNTTLLLSVTNALNMYNELSGYNNLNNLNITISSIFTNNYTVNLQLYSYDSFLLKIPNNNTESSTIRNIIYNSYIKIPEFNSMAPIRVQSIDDINYIVYYMYNTKTSLIKTTNNSLIGLSNMLYDISTKTWSILTPSLNINKITPIGEFIGRIVTKLSNNISFYVNIKTINMNTNDSILPYDTLLYNNTINMNISKQSISTRLTNIYPVLKSYIDTKNTNTQGLISACGNLPKDSMDNIIQIINDNYTNALIEFTSIIDNIKSALKTNENFTSESDDSINSIINTQLDTLNKILDNTTYDINTYNYYYFLNLMFKFDNDDIALNTTVIKLIKPLIDTVQTTNNITIDPTLNSCTTINTCLINYNSIYLKLGGVDRINPPPTLLKTLISIIVILVIVVVIGIIIIYVINVTIKDKRLYIKRLLSKLDD